MPHAPNIDTNVDAAPGAMRPRIIPMIAGKLGDERPAAE
jgi:hypothetical protein